MRGITDARLTAVVVGLCLSWAGCGGGGGDTDPRDTVVEHDVPDPEVLQDVAGEPELPEITVDEAEEASLPVLTPCPEGWREVEDEGTGLVYCDPWPETGHEECGPGQAHYPGQGGCQDVGDPCPAGDWAEDLPTDRTVVHVLAGAGAGGDGTVGAPYASIQEAVDASSTGTVIAVGKGDYEECVTVEDFREIWGACVTGTTVTCNEPAEAVGVIAAHGPLNLRNLTVGGARPGVSSMLGGRVELQGVVVSEASVIGITVGGGSSVTGNDVVVRDTGPDAEDNFGTGIQVVSGGTVELTRAVVERNLGAGVLAAYSPTTVTLTDVAIHGNLPRGDRDAGIGVDAGQGPTVTMNRVSIQDNHMVGVRAMEPGTSVTMTDCLVINTMSRARDLGQGLAFNVQTGASLKVERTLAMSHREHSLIFLQGATGQLTDLAVLDTLGRERDDLFGRGINIQSESVVYGTRVLIARAHEVGLFISSATGEWEDIIIVDTVPQTDDGDAGRAIQVSEASDVSMLRLLMERNTEIAMLVADEGTAVTIEDLVVRDTISSDREGNFGHGMQVIFGALVNVDRALFEGNRECAVLVGGPNARLYLVNTTIAGTRRSACYPDDCPTGGGGSGLVAIGGGLINASHFLVDGNTLCGVQLAHGRDADGVLYTTSGVLDLSQGIISRQPIGANVQSETFDLNRITEDVIYLDNDRNLDSSYLPVPPPGL